MRGTLRVLCRPGVADGFALAGIRAIPAAEGREAAAALRLLLEQPGLAVILVEEDLHRALPEDLLAAIERRAAPIVMAFPGPAREERPSAEAELVDLLRRAIGYRVRLR